MGVKELPALLKDSSTFYTSGGSKIFNGLVIGVDTSVLMYQAMKSDACAQQFHVTPPIPITEIFTFLDRFVMAMRSAGCKDLIFVFDGAADPAKSEEHRSQREAREESEVKLNTFYL